MSNKKYFLISNAHIDPVWQWEWEEGAAAAISTFRCAASFCREFNNYIFCHNESLIYQWIETYEPSLFEEIKELVKLGKWHIMGGWHVQPDCNIPSGEAFARQIAAGRAYFKEKFDKEPTTAINFDPFGHTRGLVQILAKSGYDSYLFCRPDPNCCPLPSDTFTWVGYDGSTVIAQRCPEGYGSSLGHATDKIRSLESRETLPHMNICLWGVGDHGGGPSRQDISAINAYIDECKAQGIEVIHTTPEAYFEAVRDSQATLPRHEGAVNSWAPGCYTSQVRIKQMYRQAENMLFSTEKMLSQVCAMGRMSYPQDEIGQVLYDLLTVQFHDILPGSSIRPAEEMALRMLSHGIEILSRLRFQAFLVLTENQPVAKEGEIPILAYNPHPYAITQDLVCEFMLADQNWSGTFVMPKVYANGTPLPSQCEKEDSNIPLDWRKRVVFRSELAPMSIHRFDVKLETIPQKPTPDPVALGGSDPQVFRFETPYMTVEIDRHTGLINRWVADGIDYLGKGSLGIHVMQDREDAWGMTFLEWKEKIGEFRLLSPEIGSRISCLDNVIPSLRVIEDGDVRTVVEVLLGWGMSHAILTYKLSKTSPTIDIDLCIANQEKKQMFKLALPIAMPSPSSAVEVAYGEEPMVIPYREYAGQKYATVVSPNGGRLTVFNRGIYGYSYADNTLYLTLLHSPAYTSHPLGDRPVLPTDRYMPHMEQGERYFSLRLVAGKATDDGIARDALSFNETPMVLSFFPKGTNQTTQTPWADTPFMTLSPSPVVMTALKQVSGYQHMAVRLFNPTANATSCTLTCAVLGLSQKINFTPFEVKTYQIQDNHLIPCRMDEI